MPEGGTERDRDPDPDSISDEDLMRASLGPDLERSLGILATRYAARALGVAALLLGDREKAKDAVQETFLRLVRKRGSFRPGSPFPPWFYTILRNACRDLGRSDARRARVLEAWSREDPGSRDEAETGSEGENLARALGAMDSDDRRLLELRLVQGLAFREIAILLDCSEAAAKKRAQRALSRLRRHWPVPEK